MLNSLQPDWTLYLSTPTVLKGKLVFCVCVCVTYLLTPVFVCLQAAALQDHRDVVEIPALVLVASVHVFYFAAKDH